MTLAWQYYYTYINKGSLSYTSNGIVFAPLEVYRILSPDSLLPKFLFSILLPLTVYLLYFGKAKQHLPLNLAWLTFLFSGFDAYFLAEDGPEKSFGNLLWSGQITLFILFAVSVAFFIREEFTVQNTGPWKRYARMATCLVVLALHLVSGMAYYYYFRQNPAERWI